MVKSLNHKYTVVSHELIALKTYKMVLSGTDIGPISPGQFGNLQLPDTHQFFLRRPLSICDYDQNTITLIYKILGNGTESLAKAEIGDIFDILAPLGTGFTIQKDLQKQILIGGGVGVPPLYYLAKELSKQNIDFDVVLGFNTKEDIFLTEEFKTLGANVFVATMDGSVGHKGHVLDLIKQKNIQFDYYYACGPERMLHALVKEGYNGQLSFEERMGCGFGACMGCSHKTLTSYKRICKEGPVLFSDEVMIDE